MIQFATIGIALLGLSRHAMSISDNWVALASDDSGKNIIASGYAGIQISHNYGEDWVQSNNCIFLSQVASSSTGQYLVYTNEIESNYCGKVMTSNDFGASWSKSDFPRGKVDLRDVTMSGSGQFITAVSYSNGNGQNEVFLSVDFGKTFVEVVGTDAIYLQIVESSKTGQKIFIAQSSGGVIMSNDFGKSFVPLSSTNGVGSMWYSLSCSESCDYIVAGKGKSLWITSDSGKTWNTTDIAATATAISNCGQYQFALHNLQPIYYSHNFGTSWTASNSPRLDWVAVTADASGQYLAAGPSSGPIWLSSDFGVTWVASKDANDASLVMNLFY